MPKPSIMKYFLALLLVLILRVDARAQATYTISGIVKNIKGGALQSATVFVAGSEKIMATDALGGFNFKVKPGIYHVVVTMVGYDQLKQTVIVENKDEIVNAVLNEHETVLNEVVIGGKISKKKQRRIDLFLSYFIGNDINSKDCKILNPEIIKFGEDQNALYAATTDFLIIENKALGYRIRYLLRYFKCGFRDRFYIYDGDINFEPLAGTAEQQAIWKDNRRLAYQGSMTHFLRALYAGKAREEGFIIHWINKYDRPVIDMNPATIFAEQIIKRTGNNRAMLRFGDDYLYILYDKQKAAQEDPPVGDKKNIRLYRPERNGTVFKLYGQFDGDGCLEEYDIKNIFILGLMSQKRVADQLPFEYKSN
jgi:hypothetical protein